MTDKAEQTDKPGLWMVVETYNGLRIMKATLRSYSKHGDTCQHVGDYASCVAEKKRLESYTY